MTNNTQPTNLKDPLRLIKDHNKSYFIKSCAGSGKTTLLTQKFIDLILIGKCNIEEIVAITFTEAAAAEMRSRIYERLLELSLNNEETNEKALRAHKALENFSWAWISTIHGFALRLIAQDPIALNLPLNIRVLSSIEKELEDQDNFSLIVQALNNNPDYQQLIKLSNTLGLKSFHIKKLIKSLKNNLEMLNNSPQLTNTEIHKPLGEIINIFENHLPKILQNIDINKCKDKKDALYQHIKKLEVVQSIIKSQNIVDKAALLDFFYKPPIDLFRIKLGTRLGNKDNWPSQDINEVKNNLKDLQILFDKNRKELSEIIVSKLLNFSANYLKERTTQRLAQGILTFDELITLAQVLLINTTAGKHITSRFKYILVDEFQDTDETQISLIKSLVATIASSNKTKLFLVGDHNQSIYSFRGANLGLYNQIEQEFKSNGEVVVSANNFRSHPQIIDFVNKHYKELLKLNSINSPPYQEMIPVNKGQISDKRVFKLVPADSNSSQSLKQRKVKEAKLIVQTIFDISQQFKKDNEELKAFSSIAILMRTRKSLQFLENELIEKKVPYRLRTADLIYHSKIADNIYRLLKAIVEPGNKIAVISALKSDYFNLCDQDLLTHHYNCDQWNYLNAQINENPQSIKDAFDTLKTFHKDLTYKSPSFALEYLYSYFELRSTQNNANNKLNDIYILNFLLSQAQNFETTQLTSLADYINLLGLIRTSENSKETLSTSDDQSDAVEIFTVHGAKGLEFPIVFLLGFDDLQQRSEIPPLAISKNNLRFYLNEKLTNYTDQESTTMKTDLKQSNLSESIRLFYVGITRAKELLFISMPQPEQSNNSSQRLESEKENKVIASYLSNLPEEDFPTWDGSKSIEIKLSSEKSNSPQSSKTLSHFLGELKETQSDKNLSLIAVTDLAQQIAREQFHISLSFAPNPNSSEISSAVGFDFLYIGQIVHKAMELLTTYKLFNIKLNELENLTTILTDSSFPQDLKNPFKKLISSLLQMVIQQLEQEINPEIFSELPIAISYNDFLIRGVLDLLIINKNRATIIDFKTTKMSLSEFKNSSEATIYDIQLLLYKLLVKKRFPKIQDTKAKLLVANELESQYFDVPLKISPSFDLEKSLDKALSLNSQLKSI
jgi:ATP-dependent helicase/nuclease subunit A